MQSVALLWWLVKVAANSPNRSWKRTPKRSSTVFVAFLDHVMCVWRKELRSPVRDIEPSRRRTGSGSHYREQRSQERPSRCSCSGTTVALGSLRQACLQGTNSIRVAARTSSQLRRHDLRRGTHVMSNQGSISVTRHSRPGTVITKLPEHPLRQHYERMLKAGTKPNLAKLTLARQIAATSLAMWKHEEQYDPARHHKQ